ncbi:vWA domain-containing protein [Granulicella arctica]|uniref:hypothetical protein n=1 Tax=Granulicella arctica TaxID=940613 RepID=UPI0021E0BFF9|nr:hypothetical protein [Granulicella arctica]
MGLQMGFRVSIVRAMLRCGACVLLAGAAFAQDEPTMTLHAYADLVQMPVLVLDSQRGRLPTVDMTRFRMTLNSGPPFRPTHVRLEGDDPIEMAILIDSDQRRNRLLLEMARGVASMVTESLGPQDKVVVYVLDCGGIRHSIHLPVERKQIEEAIKMLLVHQPLAADARQDAKACKAPPHLWSAMAYTVRELSTSPGRRVLLAVSDGQDGGSSVPWQALKDLATRGSVAVFSLATNEQQPLRFLETDDHMAMVCEFSGGLRLWSTDYDLQRKLREFVRMLRERYILDFPRPKRSPAGTVGVQVTLGESQVFIRASGVSFPLADDKLLADPTTVPSDPTRAPEVGSRRVLKSQ